jgi:hypothetical protein
MATDPVPQPNVPAKLPVKLFEPGVFRDELPADAIIY